MSAPKALVALGLTVGLGVGTAYAIHEVGNFNDKADRIEACLKQPETSTGQQESSICQDQVASQLEVDHLRRTADTFGDLGWVAFLGTAIAAVSTLDQL